MGVVPQISGGSELDEEIELEARVGTDVGKFGVDERENVGTAIVTIPATATNARVDVIEVEGTADTTATLVPPVII